MKKSEITPYLFEGDWDWREICANSTEGWITLSELSKGEHIWCFRADGVMTSKENGKPRYVVRYFFDHRKLFLILDGYQVNTGGEPHTIIYEKYRVEFISAAEVYLYDQEDVEIGLEEESLRLTLHKILSS